MVKVDLKRKLYMKNKSPKIGIVSGVGPLAGSDVLAKVFKNAALHYGAVEDNEYPDLLLVNHGIAGVDNTGSLNDMFQNDIIAMVKQLETQGASVVGIACNTAHVYLQKIKESSGVEIVNLIEIVADVATQADHKYLLLTSNASKEQKLYQGYLDAHKVVYSETTNEQQELLDEAISLIMAHKLTQAGELIEKVLSSAQSAGFTAVIAGCTELPIAIAHSKNLHGLYIIDSNDELAKALLRAYY